MTARNTKPTPPKGEASKAPTAPATYWWLVKGEVIEAATMPQGAEMRHDGTDWVSLPAPKGATAPKGTVPAVLEFGCLRQTGKTRLSSSGKSTLVPVMGKTVDGLLIGGTLWIK